MAIRINFDEGHNAISPTFVLAKRYGDRLGVIPATNVVFKDCLNSYSEISFTVNKLDTVIWDEIKDFRVIWCKEWNLWFEIYVSVDETNSLIKYVTAKSLGEAELSQINLYDIEINTDDDILREEYDELNPTVFYNNLNHKISLLHRITEKAPHYHIKHVDISLAPRQYSFSFDNISIYDAFQEISEKVNCLFVIEVETNSSNEMVRNISVYDLEAYCLNCGHRGEYIDTCPECGSTNVNNGYGNDTSIFVSSDNLADEIKYSTNVDSVKNCFRLTAGDDLMTATIANCNPNGNYLWYISDELKSSMSPALLAAMEDYNTEYNYYQNDYIVQIDSNILGDYNDLLYKYNRSSQLITEIQGYANLMNVYYDTIDLYLYLSSGMMPSVETEDTTAQEQANSLYTRINDTYVAVSNTSSASETTVNSAILNYAKTLIDSRYKIQISESSYNTVSRVWQGKFVLTNYSDDSDTYVNATNIRIFITDNYKKYVEQIIEKSLYKKRDEIDIVSLFNLSDNAFKAELELYCLARLKSFHDACQSVVDILIEQGVSNPTVWSGANDNLYQTIYLPYYHKLGYIEDEIRIRENEVNLISGKYIDDKLVADGMQTIINAKRNYIKEQVDLESFLGTTLWEEFASYRREDTYSDENCVSDGLDNAQLFSAAQNFIEEAKKEIFKSATLQHQISATLKNLLVLKEFEPIISNFEVGNWIRLRVDGKVYRLRLIEYTVDFDNLENIPITFSDVTVTMDGYTDLKSILNQASTMATSYDSISRQAEKGSRSNELLDNWVERGLSVTATKIMNDADEQTQTWDNHGMLFRRYDPINEAYEDTQLKIINSTLAITDDNWTTVKTAVGGFYYYDTTRGTMKYAYGVNAETVVGKLILGEQMKIVNSANSLSFTQQGLHITNSNNNLSFTNQGLTINAGNSQFKVNLNDNNFITVKNNSDNIFVVDSNGNATFKGAIIANSVTLSQNATHPFIQVDVAKGSPTPSSNTTSFKVSSNGLLTASNAVIYGTIYATNGEFTGTVHANSGEFTGSVTSDNVNITGGSLDISSGAYGKVHISSTGAVLSSWMRLSPPSGVIGAPLTLASYDGVDMVYFLPSGGDENRLDEVYFGSSLFVDHIKILASQDVSIPNLTTVSDIRVKNCVEAIPNKYSRFYDSISPKIFKYNDGTSNRYHIGYIAQEIEQSLLDSNLSTMDFAGLIKANSKNGVEYRLRYDEFIALNTWQIQKLKQRVSELENFILNTDNK